MSALTPQQQQIVRRVKAGNFRETAAASAGVSVTTLRNWLSKGANNEQPYKSFSEALDTAEARAEVSLLKGITKAAKEDHRAAIAILERRWRERWAKQDLDLKREMERLVQIMSEELPHKKFVRILLRFDHRSTMIDEGKTK